MNEMNPHNQHPSPLPSNHTSISTMNNTAITSIKTRFAVRFLYALKKIRTLDKQNHPSSGKKIRRCKRVKIAANASMASAVGSSRAWTRALLSNLRRRRRTSTTTTVRKNHRAIATSSIPLTRAGQKRKRTKKLVAGKVNLGKINHGQQVQLPPPVMIKTNRCGLIRTSSSIGVGGRRRSFSSCGGGSGGRQVGQLRELVPGGEAMDAHTLLDETAHYIKCLTTQVSVMRNILNYCASPPPSI